MIVAPPVLAGVFQLTVACAFPATALVPVGAPGTVRGVTALDALLGDPVPALLAAVTVNVYEVPLLRPVTMQDSVPLVRHVEPPGLAVTV